MLSIIKELKEVWVFFWTWYDLEDLDDEVLRLIFKLNLDRGSWITRRSLILHEDWRDQYIWLKDNVNNFSIAL